MPSTLHSLLKDMLNIRRLFLAARYSLAGLGAATRLQTAFRQELVAGAVLVPIAVWLGDSGVERALMIGSLGLVLIMELVNSAIESVVDRIGEDRNELSGRAKDLGSAAVLMSLVTGAAVWGLVLLG